MSKITLSPDVSGSGTFTIAAPNSNTDRTLTLPDNTGTVITTASTFAGTGPAFSAYGNTNQSIATNTATKIQFQVEEFDTASAFDAATNYRFQPLVAGYYQINAGVLFNMNSVAGTYFVMLYKNGTAYKRGTTLGGSNVQNVLSCVSSLVYLNGSTDYAEIYGFQNSAGSLNTLGGIEWVWVNGAMVRAA